MYDICTKPGRNEPHFPAMFRKNGSRGKNGFQKFPMFQGHLWWARQGLNLRPHPCEGSSRSQLTICKKIIINDTRVVRCTPIVRRAAKTILSYHGSGPPTLKRKTAGRAGTLPGGKFHSVTAISSSYAMVESGARANLAGGAK